MHHSKSHAFLEKSHSLRSIQINSKDLGLSHPSPYGKDRFCTPDHTPTKSPRKSLKNPLLKTRTPTSTPIRNNSTTCLSTPRKVSKLVIEEQHQLDAPDLCLDLPSQVFAFHSADKFAVTLQEKIYLWESGNVSLFTETSSHISCIHFCHDNLLISYDGKVELWDLNSNSCIKELPSHKGKCNIITSSNYQVATGGSDGIIHISNLLLGSIKSINTKMGEIISLSYSPNGSFLASTSSDGQIRIWGDHRPHFFQHGTTMNYVTWLNDEIIAVGDNSENGEIKLFSLRRLLNNSESTISTGSSITSLIHSPKWGILVSHLSSQSSFEIYNHSLKKIRKFDKGKIICMSITQDESELAICTTDEFVLIFSLKEGVSHTERKSKRIPLGLFIR